MNPHLKKVSAAGMLITLGIIFGDIGTSPLYTFQTLMQEGGTADIDFVFGAISCVFWTLTLQTTFKYIFITLQADNHGEGGIFLTICSGEALWKMACYTGYNWCGYFACRWYNYSPYFRCFGN